MKFVIDECVLGKTTRLLKESGFSLVTIQELGKMSVTDKTVINIANGEKAVIITNDLDFGNLILYPLGSHGGVIVLRPRLDTPEAAASLVKISLGTELFTIEKNTPKNLDKLKGYVVYCIKKGRLTNEKKYP